MRRPPGGCSAMCSAVFRAGMRCVAVFHAVLLWAPPAVAADAAWVRAEAADAAWVPAEAVDAAWGPAEAADAAWAPVDDAVLAGARGGFDGGGGLLVSLSVERVLSMDGNVVASSQLSVPDVARAVSGEALATFQLMAAGAGNRMPHGGSLPPAGLVLQNSASGQLIQGRTTIDAAVNSLSVLKGLNFGDSLRQALSTATLPR